MLIPKQSTTDSLFLSFMAWFQSYGYLRDAWTPLEFLWWLVRMRGKLAYYTTYKWLSLWQEQLIISWIGLIKAGSTVVSVLLCQSVCAWRQWIRSDVCECQKSLQCLAWDVCLSAFAWWLFLLHKINICNSYLLIQFIIWEPFWDLSEASHICLVMFTDVCLSLLTFFFTLPSLFTHNTAFPSLATRLSPGCKSPKDLFNGSCSLGLLQPLHHLCCLCKLSP